MRNLKKILALALALVMTLSLMTVANAFNDDKDVNSTYAEAVEVLSGLGVFKGVNDGSNFAPKQTITRAEVAAIIYRIVTGDVADRQDGIYADYAKFKDVAANHWAAGYIGYCSNAELIVGDGTNFYPDQTVNGYQALAMILRAMGYDQNDEFKGEGWEIRVASTAQQKGVLKNVNAGTLGVAATRELVAELLFQAISGTNTVFYLTNTMSYMDEGSTLGYQTFGLAKGNRTTIDNWGRPGYTWTATKNSLKMPTVATIEEAYLAQYTTAVTECDIAADVHIANSANYALYVNAKVPTANYVVNATDTVTKVGAQGRLTEVYADRIVMIDTFLAQVASVSDAAYDAAGHLRTPATITLTVYDADGVTTGNKGSTNTRTLTLTNGTVNYPYAKGEFVLLNAYTNPVNSATASGTVITADATKYGEIVGKATSVAGAQSVIYWNAQQHNVGGTVYNDAVKFYLDDAGVSTANHTWYFDQYNNLIGATEIAAATSYGVITSIWWAGNTTDGSGLANATVTYMDGTTGTVTISYMTVNNADVGSPYQVYEGKPTYSTVNTDIMTFTENGFCVSPDARTNARSDAHKVVGGHLFQFTTQANGTVTAMEVGGTANDTVAKMASVETAIYKNTQIYNSLIVNANTVFLVKAGNTFTTVTGFQNIGNYVSGEVDYVDVDNNGVADYVYITAAATASKVTSLLYYTGEQMSYANGYWTVPCYVDGEKTTVLVADSTGTTTSGIINNIVTNIGKLLKVQLTDGVVTGYNAVYTTIGHQVTSNDSTNFPMAPVYTGYNSTVYVDVLTGEAGDSYIGNLYRDANGKSYSYVEGVTKGYGDFTADMSGKNVIVVYVNNSGNAGNGIMLQAYVVDKSSVVPDPTPVTTGNIVRVVEIYQGGNLIGSRSATQTGVTAQTYTTGQDYATVSAALPSLNVAGATVVEDVTSVTVVAGQTVTVTYKVAL